MDKDDKEKKDQKKGKNKVGVRTVIVSGKNNGYWRTFNLCCEICNRRYETQRHLKQHISDMKHFKDGQSYKCGHCDECFLSTRAKHQHESLKHKDANGEDNSKNNNDTEPIPTKGMKRRGGGVKEVLPSVINEHYNIMIENITADIMKKVEAREKIENDKLKQQRADIEASTKLLETELKKRFAQLNEEINKAALEREEREAAVALKEKKLEEEIQKMKDLNDHGQEKIRLNVGGSLFLTTKSTLTKFSDSMLGTMFSGRHKIVVEKEDSAVFIDRSPQYFSQILNYLRDGDVFVPDNEQDKYGLIKEADFYGLKGLVDLVQAGEKKSDKNEKSVKRSAGTKHL